MSDNLAGTPPPAAAPADGPSAPPPSAPRPSRRRRWRRRILWGLAGLVAVLVLLPATLAAGILIWANSEGGRAWIVARVAEATAGSGAKVRIGDLSPGLPGAILVRDLSVSDAEGAWLTLAEAELRWDPWRLLTGVLRVDSLTGRRIAIARLPVAQEEAEEPTTPFDPQALLPDLPIAVSIGEIDLREIEIAEPVAGTAASLNVQARLSLAPQSGAELTLDIRRTDGVGGALTGRADIVEADGGDRIDLELELTEPAGGLIAGMSGWPADAGVRLRVAGSGPLSALEGTVTAAVGTIAELDGRFESRYRGSGAATDLTLELKGDIAALLPEPVRQVAGAGQDLTVAATAEESGALAVRQLALTTPALSLKGEARLDPAAGPVSADLVVDRLDAAALQGFVPGLELAQPRIGIKLGGTMTEPAVDLQVDASRIALDDTAVQSLSLTASARPQGPMTDTGLPPFDIVVTAGSGAVVLPDPAATALLAQGLQLDLAGRVDPAAEAVDLKTATLALPVLRLTAEGRAAASGRGELKAQVAVPDLAALGGAFDLPLKGGLQADLTADGSDLLSETPGNWQARLAARLTEAGFGDLPLQPLLGETARLDVAAGGRGAERVDITQLSLKGAAIAAEGGGTLALAAERVDADLQLNVSDLSALTGLAGMPMAGAARLQVDLKGGLAAPALSADLRLQDAVLDGIPVAAALTADTPSLALPLTAKLDLQGRAMDLPLRLRSGMAVNAEATTLALRDLRASLADAAVSGGLSLDLETSLAEGRLDLDVSALGPLTRRFGTAVDGAVKGSVTLAGRPAGQGITTDIIASGVALPEDGPTMQSARLQSDLVMAPKGPRGTLNLELTGVEQADGELDRLVLRAEGDLASQMRASLEGDGVVTLGDSKKPLSLGAQAVLTGLPPDLSAELSQIRLSLDDTAIRQRGSAALAMKGEDLTLKGLRLDIDGGGRISVAARSAPSAIDLDVEVASLPLALAGLVTEEVPLTGTADLNIDLELRPGRPKGNAVLSLKDLMPVQEDYGSLPPSNVTARAELADTRLRLQADWEALGADPGRFTLAVPIASPAGALIPEPDMGAPISGRLSWSGDLAQLGVFVPVDSEIGGRFAADLTIGGTLDTPRVPGSVQISDGIYRNYTTGTIVRDLQARIDGGEDGRLEIAGEAGDSTGGRLDVHGYIDLAADPLPTFVANLTTQRFVAARLELATAAISADLKASGTPLRNAVEGTVTVESLEIQIDGGLPASATVIPVVVVPRPGAPPLNPREPKEASTPSRTRLDIAVRVPPRMTVEGRGLQSIWSGNLQVAGTTNNPRVTGRITAERGSFNLVGRQFDLSEGVIAFDGGTPPNPSIDITLTYDSGEAVANIVISGTASDPKLNLTSVPAMPEGDIISTVLFDRRTSQLSAAEALEVATSLAALTGQGTPGAGVTGQVRQALGLDVLSVGSGADGEPAVNAGRYITDDVYVGVRQGLGSSSSSVAVQVDLTDNIQLETDVGVDSNSSVGVNWKYDY